MQLSAFLLHFVASNYVAFEDSDHFPLLEGENLEFVQEHRWPPLSYYREMEEYREKYGDLMEGVGLSGKKGIGGVTVGGVAVQSGKACAIM